MRYGKVSIEGRLDVTGTLGTVTGLSGSLTRLSDGTSYLIAGSNVTITSQSNGSVVIDSTGGGGGGGISQITGSVLASGTGIVGGTVVNIDGQSTYYGQFSSGFIDTLMLEPSTNGDLNGKNFNMIAASSTNPNDSMAILATNRNAGSGLSHLYIGKAFRPSAVTIRTEIHSNGTVATYSVDKLGTTVENDGYGHAMTTIASSLAYTCQERFTSNFTTDLTNQGSHLLEANLPGGGSGATLTIRAYPYPGGPGSRSGRVYIVSDVAGTLTPTNALSVSDAEGRTFNGSASPYVMDSAYESNTFILDSTQSNWIVIPSQQSGGGGGSGASYFDSTTAGSVFTTGSVAFRGGESAVDSPSDVGTDVFFYVSGSISGSGIEDKKSVFGGDVRISGSFSQGDSTIASGLYSHAEGLSSTANGNFSHAEGLDALAIGAASHAEGESTRALFAGSHAEGFATHAENDYSHAEGYATRAEGAYGSHAEGNTTIAKGDASHAGGWYTIASGSAQTAVGKYNKRNNSFSLFVIGDGTDDFDVNRSDIVRVNSGSTGGAGSVQVTGSFAVSGSSVQLISTTVDVSGSMQVTGSLDVMGTLLQFGGDVIELSGTIGVTGSLSLLGDMSVSGSYLLNVVSGTAPASVYYVGLTDHLVVFTSNVGVTASLNASAPVGAHVVFKDGTGLAGSVGPQMISSSAGLIDGQATFTMPATNYSSVTVVRVSVSPEHWVVV